MPKLQKCNKTDLTIATDCKWSQSWFLSLKNTRERKSIAYGHNNFFCLRIAVFPSEAVALARDPALNYH